MAWKSTNLGARLGPCIRSCVAQYNIVQDIKDFEEALKILEGGFISISSGRVTFINPSVCDYLTDYLDDPVLLGLFAKAPQKVDSAKAVWNHSQVTAIKSTEQKKSLGEALKSIARLFPQLPVKKRDPVEPNRYQFYDSSLSNRLSLLLEWYVATGDGDFSDTALSLVEQRSSAFFVGIERLAVASRRGPFPSVPSSDRAPLV